jgi:hypothetical protein
VFVRSGTSWSQQAKLAPIGVTLYDFFGYAVAISGDTAVVGAIGDDDNGAESGSAYVFVRSGTSWPQQAKLMPTDGAADDHFGGTVAISGDTAVVGAPFDDDNASQSGSAYVFVRSGTSWSQQAKLTASDGAEDDFFGGAVAISEDTVVVGSASDDDNGSQSGSVYGFVRSGTSWPQQAKLTAADGAADDGFGYAVAISGNAAVVGAGGDDDNGSTSGSAYVYALALSNGDACTTNEACASGFCTDGVCCDTACNGQCLACNNAGSVGTCSTVDPLTDDPMCAANQACDASGMCKLKIGEPCTMSSDCATNVCSGTCQP